MQNFFLLYIIWSKINCITSCFESFLITFRECLEMALISGIMLGFLKKTNQTKYNNIVYLGIIAGIFVSVLFAFAISYLWQTLSEAGEQIFEGVLMLIAAGLLTSMIVWFFHKQSSIREGLENQMKYSMKKWAKFGLFGIVFLSILREGFETVLFLSAIFANSDEVLAPAISAFVGIFIALLLGYLLFVAGKKLPMRLFFVPVIFYLFFLQEV